jgi:hypothetical protein
VRNRKKWIFAGGGGVRDPLRGPALQDMRSGAPESGVRFRCVRETEANVRSKTALES